VCFCFCNNQRFIKLELTIDNMAKVKRKRAVRGYSYRKKSGKPVVVRPHSRTYGFSTKSKNPFVKLWADSEKKTDAIIDTDKQIKAFEDSEKHAESLFKASGAEDILDGGDFFGKSLTDVSIHEKQMKAMEKQAKKWVGSSGF